MLNTVYRLVEPGRIEAGFSDIDITADNVLVRPTYLSICNADQRYFQGTRPAGVLRSKLPMALIHEGIGEVIFDMEGEFPVGSRVVMVPNTPCEEDVAAAENYLPSSRFRSSGYDGFMQDIVSIRRDRVLSLPDCVNNQVGAFTELVSVAYHTVDRFDAKAHSRRNVIGVWGDGNLAFITSLLLKKRMPDSRVIVFGKHEYKLREFVFADECCRIDDLPDGIGVDHGFECVGGMNSGKAINQMIDIIGPEGCIAAMGVSEDNVPVNTRMMLEKGLTVFGSSRSGAKDFLNLLDFYEANPDIVEYLGRIVGSVVPVRSISDMSAAFEIDMQKKDGKTIMEWMK